MVSDVNPNGIELGHVVESGLYGFKGVVTVYQYHLNGMHQLVVTVPGKDNAVPETEVVDAGDLTRCQVDGLKDLVPVPPKWRQHVALGDEVRSSTVGVSGVLSELWVGLNGNVEGSIALKESLDDRNYLLDMIDSFELVKARTVEPAVKQKGSLRINTSVPL